MDRAEESSVMIAPHALQEMSSQAGSTQAERWHFLLGAQPPGTLPQTMDFRLNSQLTSLCPRCFVLKELKASQAVEVSAGFLLGFFCVCGWVFLGFFLCLLDLWLEKQIPSVSAGSVCSVAPH